MADPATTAERAQRNGGGADASIFARPLSPHGAAGERIS
jgi:hypothetical protein